MSPVDVRKVLYKFDILPSDRMWKDLVRRMDKDGDGRIDFQEFMDFFGKEQGGDKDAYFIGKVQNVSLASAKQMIQDKVRGKTEGGPGIQRRAFQMFDRDRSGEVDRAEFISAMKKYLYLDFNEATLNNLFAAFDPENTGCIDFDRFTTLVMGGGSQRELTRSTSLPMVKMMTSSLLRSGVSGVSLPRFYEDPYRVC